MRFDLRLLGLFFIVFAALGFGSPRDASAQPACPNAVKKGVQYDVKIDSAPPGAAIYVDSKQCPSIGQTPWTGKLNAGAITIVIEKQGYKPATKTFNVARVRKQQDLFVPLEAQPRIEINPSADKNLVDADVTLDGVPAGKVSGPLIIQTTAARHLIEIKKAGFETFQQWVDLSANPAIVLTPVLKVVQQFGSIFVESDMRDAEIYIDQNKHPDNTPATIQQVPVGVHVIEVRKNGKSQSKPVTVTANQQAKVLLELNAGVGVVKVVSDAKDAKVYIDGQEKGVPGQDLKDIPAGEHILEVKAPGFKTFRQTIVVTAGGSVPISATLEADVPSDSGTVKIIVKEPGAETTIDGVVVPAGEDVRRPAGEYVVQVRKPGFKQFEQKVKIEAGKPTVVRAELKQAGKLRVIAKPSGATVSINGLVVGKASPAIDVDVETGEVMIKIEAPGYDTFDEKIQIAGGDKLQIFSRELPRTQLGAAELQLEQKGLSSFGARTLPRGRSTVDFDAGYPYFLNTRITVGAGRLAQRFGFDANVAVRTMFDRTELGIGGRAMMVNADPFTAGVFTQLWYGSKLFDDSQRNGVTWEVGGVASLTALSNVTISGRAYLQFWSDRHCPELQPGNTFEATDPAAVCVGYLNRRIIGNGPENFNEQDALRAEKLTGNKGMDFFGRDGGARLMLSIAAEISVRQHWSVYGVVEGAPFQGKDERALFTDLFSEIMPETDYLLYARFGLTYKF